VDDNGMFPSIIEIMLAGIAIVLIPVGVLLLFSVRWWLAFIPLGISAVIIIWAIIAFFRGRVRDFESKEYL
jgi:membrane protein implicated in regulation of membrane protease activity